MSDRERLGVVILHVADLEASLSDPDGNTVGVTSG